MNTELLFNAFLSHLLDPVFTPPSYFPNSVIVQTFILCQLDICSSLLFSCLRSLTHQSAAVSHSH